MSRLEPVCALQGHADRVWCVAWSPTGSLLASCGGDKTVRIWALEGSNWVCKTVLDGGHQRTIRSVAWSHCGHLLATASFDGTVCIWDRRSGEFDCSATLEGHENEVKCVSWAPSGEWLATCSRDKSVWIWEVDEENHEYECASVLSAHTQDVKKIAWHPTQEILASCSYDNSIKLIKEDGDDWTSFATLDSHESTVWSISFSKSGSQLASVSDDRTMKIWQQFLPGNTFGIPTIGKDATWRCVCTLSGYHNRPVYDVSWCPNTDAIATACGDDNIRIFMQDPDTAGNVEAPSFILEATVEKAHAEDVNSVTWNPKESGLLASCGDDGLVKLWRLVSDSGS